MKNKFLAVVCIALIALLGFASCEEEVACEHTFSSKWSTNETNHWHAATCEHGEIKGQNGAHVDADENGKCDTCEYEIGHEHTYADEWTINETNHWKAATCVHTDEKGFDGLHADDDVDGECDVCATHVHTLDGAGFCSGCNKEIKPVVETDIASVISATTARVHNVNGGSLDFYNVSRWADESQNLEISQKVEYLLGTNGTHRVWLYDEVDVNGKKTGKTERLDQWLRLVNNDTVEGVDAISVDGVYKSAQPGNYSLDDLKGYFYTISTLADAFSPEELLLNLYNAYVDYHTEDYVVAHDAEANKYQFSFKALAVQEATVDNGAEIYYTASYFEVEIAFTYADDYTLTDLTVNCDVWTSDAGIDDPFDFTYDPQNGMVWESDPIADTYTLSVTQNIGARGEIALNDGSEFKPTTFEIYTDSKLTRPLGTSFTLDVTDVDKQFYVSVGPEGTFASFFMHEFTVDVVDKNGNVSHGFGATLIGTDILLMPFMSGEYRVTFKALGIEHTLDVTVTSPAPLGDSFFDVQVLEAYSWSDEWNGDKGVYYEFTASVAGKYTFYLPPHLSMVEVSVWDRGGEPDFDHTGLIYNAKKAKVTVELAAGQVYKFYIMGSTVGTYTIGYVAP